MQANLLCLFESGVFRVLEAFFGQRFSSEACLCRGFFANVFYESPGKRTPGRQQVR